MTAAATPLTQPSPPSGGEGFPSPSPPLGGEGRGEGAAHTRVSRARALRRSATPAERILWQALRNSSIGSKAKRQVPRGPWILDFLFASQRLVVEADGDTHAATIERDERRDAWLAARGYRVLRFSNRDILGNLDGVLQSIAQALAPP